MSAVLAAVLLAWLFGGGGVVDELLPEQQPAETVTDPAAVAADETPVVQAVRAGATTMQKLIVLWSLGAIIVGLLADWWNTWRRKQQARRAGKEVCRLAEVRGGPALGHAAGEQPDQKMLAEILGRVEGIDASIGALEERVAALQARAHDAGRAIKSSQ